MASPSQEPGVASSELTEAVEGGRWKEVFRMVNNNNCSHQHGHWAIEKFVKHAPVWYVEDRLDDVCNHCTDDKLSSVLHHLLARQMWRCVGRVMQRAIKMALHRRAVEETSRLAEKVSFHSYILPHCHDDDMECVLTHLASRGLWWLVEKVLEKGVNPVLHQKAVEQASKHADAASFDFYVLPHCRDEQLEIVLTHLVSRGLWGVVDKVLKRGVTFSQQRWAIEEALKHADGREFAEHILPQCTEEELDTVLAHMVARDLWKPINSVADKNISISTHILSLLMSNGWWFAVGRFLKRDIDKPVRTWAVEEAMKSVDEWDLCYYILPHCTEEELEQVITHMVLKGLWEPGDTATDSYISATQRVLSQLMSHDQWLAVAMFLEQDISCEAHRCAVEQASRLANDNNYVHFILPHCRDEELGSVLTHLVSRGLWRPVREVLERGVNSNHHRWAVEQASRYADDLQFVFHILPQSHDEELQSVLTHLLSRGLWRTVGKVLERRISCMHRRLAIEQASKHSKDDDFVKFILPCCCEKELVSVLFHLASRGLWRSLDKVLEKGVNSSYHRLVLVQATELADDSNYHQHLVHHCSEDDVLAVFPHLVAKKMWKCMQHILLAVVRKTLCNWITSERDSRTDDTLFWKIMHGCHVEMSLTFGVTKSVTQQTTHNFTSDIRSGTCKDRCSDTIYSIAGQVSWQRKLCELLMTSLLYTLCDVMCSDDRAYTESTECTKKCVSEIYNHMIDCVKDNTNCIQDNELKTIQNKQKWTSVFTDLTDSQSNDPLFLLHFMQGLNLYDISRRRENDDAILLVMLTVFPLFPQLQSVALKIMLHEKRWDVLSQACLSRVWEHDRRRLFRAAVMQGQWDVVRQWCDHTVHDDQRHWALTEAFKEKQWEVYLLLADHGLTVDEQMYAHYRVAKYGHWATVLNMVERGGDITEVSNLLEKWVMRYLRKKPEGDVTSYEERCMKLIRLRLRFAKKSALSPRKALERCLWGSVMFNILHRPSNRYYSQVLDKLIEEQQWHILMHLVRLGMTSADRDRLFPDMVRQQQWGVCRKLLEYGVDDQLCLEALPELMERNQWILVARLMEYNVDDALRRQVMHWAFQQRSGALFWHCLATMEDQEHMSVEIQRTLFHQAICREIWQAVKPLVKEKGSPDIQRRDLAFLEAIEQHLWDVVDYCQRLGADINMKDENGETPLNREARKREWKAVEEIVLRDGDPNHLDKDGVSVMNRLIQHQQWDTVKILIMYGGDIHLPARCSECTATVQTPLQALITARQADVIHSTIKWCGGQDWGVNDKGERVLHAVCDSDRWDVMRDLIDIKVNPLVVSNTGKSPLVYAVLNTKCGQRMVAECSRQGFSLHQSSVTGPQESLLDDISRTLVKFSWNDISFCDHIRWHSKIKSPLVCAVLCDLPVVAFMLYESGSCSNSELLTLYTQLPKLADLNTEEGRKLHTLVRRETGRREGGGLSWIADLTLQRYCRLTHTLQQYTPFLRDLATIPRSLLSSCRLKISNHFHFRNKYRHREMDLLRLPGLMKEYLKFSDLCDPDYGGHMK